MSRWVTAFENQKILPRLNSVLSTLDSTKMDEQPAAALEEYGRLVKVINYIIEKLNVADPEMMRVKQWSQFSTWLESLQSEVNNFIQSKNIVHLQSANAQVDEMLGSLDFRKRIDEPEVAKAFLEANTSFQKKIIEELELLRERSSKLREQVNLLSQAVDQGQAKVKETNDVLEQQKMRLDQVISDFQRQFSEAQEKRSVEYTNRLKGFSDKFAEKETVLAKQSEEMIKKGEEELALVIQNANKVSSDNFEFIKRREAEVNAIFGAIGTAAFAGNFKNTADQERKAANLLRWVALSLMGLMVIFGFFTFLYSLTHDAKWEIFIFRLGTVLILAVPAFYAANESSKHRERERSNIKNHLELASIDSYLALMPTDQQNKIKEFLVEKFFGVPDVIDKSEEVTKKDIFGLVANIVGNLTKGK